ncbi:MAG: glycosyltransferase, partial [Candidatus Dormibacteria bacterium]
MRVLYFVERYRPYIGGVEVISTLVLPALRERGHDITVLTSLYEEDLPAYEELDGIPVHRLPLIPALRANDLDRLIEVRGLVGELHRDIAPDLLHVVFTGPSIYYVLTGAPNPAPMVLSFHGSWPDLTIERHGLLGRALSSAAWVTACSRSALDDLRNLDPGVTGRSSVIYSGLPAPSLTPAPLAFDRPVLLCA